MSARYETQGQNNWHYRSGYQRTQRNPAPIQAIVERRPSWLARVLGR